MIRMPAVAGRFYPADPETLTRDLHALTAGRKNPEDPRGLAVMVPHAGYIYSGAVAGATYTAVRLPRRAVILCPNHTGEGEPIAVMDRGRLRQIGTRADLVERPADDFVREFVSEAS